MMHEQLEGIDCDWSAAHLPVDSFSKGTSVLPCEHFQNYIFSRGQMSRRILLLLSVCIFMLPVTAFAKPKVKKFDNTPDEVYVAALRTARSQHVVTFTDDKNHMFTFETGVSALSYGFVANASVEPTDDHKAQLIINVQHKNQGKNASFSFGAGDRMADKFFEQVQEELANKSSQPVAEKAEAAHVDVPSGTAATPTTATSADPQQGIVSVTSNPEGADVSVDGSFVGNAPAVLKLSPGKHTVSVNESGFGKWTKDLLVMAGSSVKLNATLTKQ